MRGLILLVVIKKGSKLWKIFIHQNHCRKRLMEDASLTSPQNPPLCTEHLAGVRQARSVTCSHSCRNRQTTDTACGHTCEATLLSQLCCFISNWGFWHKKGYQQKGNELMTYR